jgi:hypothetical protein
MAEDALRWSLGLRSRLDLSVDAMRSDELFPVLAAQLTERFPDVEVVGHEVFGNLHGADETERLAQLPGELQERDVDAVVSGMGC